MFGDSIIIRGEEALNSVKGTIPGNRGFLVGRNLAGTPFPHHGIPVVWTGTAWKPEGTCPLDSTDDLKKYAGIDGTRATVGTSEVVWNGSAWVGSGAVFPTYDTWDLAVAAAGSTLGWEGYVKRLCGNGYFRVMHNGVRLGVGCGESIIRDAGINSAGYPMAAAAAGAYVALASYTIPAGLIGDGEEWEVDFFGNAPGTHGGTTSVARARISGATMLAVIGVAGAGRGCRNRGGFARLGNIATVAPATYDIYSNSAGIDATVDFSAAVPIDAGWVPGSIGDNLRLRHWTFRRIG